MDALTLVLLGAVVTGFTQAAKRLLPNVPDLVIVACMALAVGMFQSFILPLIPEGVWLKLVQGFTAAVTVYEVLLRNITKKV